LQYADLGPQRCAASRDAGQLRLQPRQFRTRCRIGARARRRGRRMSRAGHRSDRGDAAADQTGACYSRGDNATRPLHESPFAALPRRLGSPASSSAARNGLRRPLAAAIGSRFTVRAGAEHGSTPVAQPITEDVMAAARKGDGTAFRTIYQELAPIVLGYPRSHGVPDPEAVTSDIFVSVLQRMDRLVGGVAGLRTFVMSVAHARYVDEARRRRRQPRAAAYDATLDPRITGSAEDEALAYVGAASILVLLQSLPTDQREVLSLRFVADIAIDDVAAIIGRSPGAVKQLQRRGLLALRRLLAEQAVTR
jgi:RNA polymerase sigma-70 factor (ECF subfamily)